MNRQLNRIGPLVFLALSLASCGGEPSTATEGTSSSRATTASAAPEPSDGDILMCETLDGEGDVVAALDVLDRTRAVNGADAITISLGLAGYQGIFGSLESRPDLSPGVADVLRDLVDTAAAASSDLAAVGTLDPDDMLDAFDQAAAVCSDLDLPVAWA